jgi:3D (Asp-Asp-Asp) domain-containing protein
MLVTTSAGSVRSRRTTDDDNTYSITGGDYEYVSYKQTKYEAMFKDENGNTENGWCGVTAYADALASVGCTNESGEKITPYDVRTDEDCGSQYVNVGGWCAKFISSNFPDVNYEYALGYTKDWIDEKLSEGMMVGIYLSSRANWKENYTGKTKVTSSAHWILIVGKISNTEYSCINPADGSGDENYVQEENAEYGSVGTLTIDLSGLTSSSPSASSGDIRICSGDSAGSSDGKPRTSYSPPAFAIGTDATQNVTLESDGSYYVDENGNKYISLGDDWTITAYCGCSLCCGSNADGITASGAKARANHTIAVDTSVIPMGTKVVIDGVVYTAEDTGSAIVGHKIDVYMEHHEEASHYKKTNYTVYKKAEED